MTTHVVLLTSDFCCALKLDPFIEGKGCTSGQVGDESVWQGLRWWSERPVVKWCGLL